VIGELHGIDGPDLVAEALEGENGRAIPDMAIRDVGLNGKNGHRCTSGT
jgi:hypothetical protein